MITTEKAKARIDSDLRKLDEPYQSQLRSFIGKSLMQRALEEEMKQRGGGYQTIAGAWKGTYDTPPELTE